jgi:hypothetical protein
LHHHGYKPPHTSATIISRQGQSLFGGNSVAVTESTVIVVLLLAWLAFAAWLVMRWR